MGKIGGLEIALIILAVVLIFGVGKLGQVGGALGRSIRDFRRERDKKDDDSATASGDAKGEQASAKSTKEKFCPSCGNKLAANSKFCKECGAKMEDFS